MARVLIVLDGDFRFLVGGTSLDFTYTALLDALAGAGHQVTKAHRNTETSESGIDTSPGVITSFSFNTGNLLDYDVIWLIGWEGRNSANSSGNSGPGIADDEIVAIARFMAAGGGVFATGDHDGIGNQMCGKIPRVRAMRCWYGDNDMASPMDDNFPRNFPRDGASRADTTQRNTGGNYGDDESFVWFENQSDTVPQRIDPTTTPAHPILRRGDSEIRVYPDHMHEGNTLGDVADYHDDTGSTLLYNYAQSLTFAGDSFVEFPEIAGHREKPQVIATGKTVPYASHSLVNNMVVAGEALPDKTVNTLSVYDGRVAGVGRIVTGSTFHHYVDINLTGDSVVNTKALSDQVGPNARKGHGLSDDIEIFENIKAVFVNITNWLARPRPAIQLILERSTFSQAEATANSDFDGAILVTVDGLKPNQFPIEEINILSPSVEQLQNWAPIITPSDPTSLEITPIGINSDDPALPDRLQRFTFRYRVSFTDVAAAFGVMPTRNISVAAELNAATVSAPLTDSAQITLVQSANPFMLDLADGNTTPWLSSDVKVFPVVAGADDSGLVDEALREDALTFLRGRLSTMTDIEFDGLTGDQEASALSPFERTTTGGMRKVYNFAVARVRLPATVPAEGVRVFFRSFTTQTTAALTYYEWMGVPVFGYQKTAGPTPIALPGVNDLGTEWLSFPMFLAPRDEMPEAQIDADNVKNILPGGSSFFGCLIDNNLTDLYLPDTPTGGDKKDLPTLMMGEHQCIVAQIEFPGTPIPNGANPFTSDKLSQRNIALSAIPNPGLDASRVALHTFEIEATPHVIGDRSPPDELLLEWHSEPPEGTEVRLEISTWEGRAVVELADRFYPRHEIRALDAHTIAVPGGGVRYVPIPRSNRRPTGVIAVHFPLGVRKGMRFDLSVRQVTTRRRQVDLPRPKTTEISREDAARILANRAGPAANAPVKRGVFDLGQNRVLITDLRVFDAAGDYALIVEHPDPETVKAAVRKSGRWRETIGAFQLGIPVSDKEDMLAHHIRLLSVLRWRAEWLRPNNRWYKTFLRYVELNAEKVRALGGDPFAVPATPDGNVPLPGKGEDRAGCVGCLGGILLAIRRWARGYKHA